MVEHRARVVEHVERVRRVAAENTQRAQQKMKKLHDLQAVLPPFSLGDKVWVYTPKNCKGLSKKLAHNYHGPYRIVEFLSPVHCFLRAMDNRRVSSIVYVARMKRYVDPASRQYVNFPTTLTSLTCWTVTSQTIVFPAPRCPPRTPLIRYRSYSTVPTLKMMIMSVMPRNRTITLTNPMIFIPRKKLLNNDCEMVNQNTLSNGWVFPPATTHGNQQKISLTNASLRHFTRNIPELKVSMQIQGMLLIM